MARGRTSVRFRNLGACPSCGSPSRRRVRARGKRGLALAVSARVLSVARFARALVQVACLAMLWGLKQYEPLAMVFPSVIGVLLLIRAKVLPRIFTRRQLLTLDTQYAGEGGRGGRNLVNGNGDAITDAPVVTKR